MKAMLKRPTLAVMAALVAACGGGSEPVGWETVARSVDTVQCEPPPVTVAELDGDLASAGVMPRSTSCAWDGMARVAACGSPAPWLRLIEIPLNQHVAALSLGYRPLDQFAAVVPMDCPRP